MPIRSSITTNVADNVIPAIGKINLKDARGTVDPTKNAYEGSKADLLGIEQENARAVLMGIANGNDKGLDVPSALPVRDVLSFVRMPNSPGWGVEYRYRERVRSPLTGVRGFCVVTCQSGSAKAVHECSDMTCPLWALRLGRNAHYGKKS